MIISIIINSYSNSDFNSKNISPINMGEKDADHHSKGKVS